MAVTLFSYAITSLAKVKLALGITDSNSDALLTQMINSVTDYIEGYCGGRRFKSSNYVETYDTNRQSKIFLNQYPVTAISAVEYRAGTISSPVWTTYDVNGYFTYLKEGYLDFVGRLPRMRQGIRIGYTAGYLIDFDNEGSATHTLPADLSQVATDLVAKLYKFKDNVGMSKVSTEGQSIEWSTEVGSSLDEGQKNVLSKYQANRLML